MIDLSMNQGRALSGEAEAWYSEFSGKITAWGQDLAHRVEEVAFQHLEAFAASWTCLVGAAFLWSGVVVAVVASAVGGAIVWRAWQRRECEEVGEVEEKASSAQVIAKLCVEYEVTKKSSQSSLDSFNQELKALVAPAFVSVSKHASGLQFNVDARGAAENLEVALRTMARYLRDVAVLNISDGAGVRQGGLSDLLDLPTLRYVMIRHCPAVAQVVEIFQSEIPVVGLALADCDLCEEERDAITERLEPDCAVIFDFEGDSDTVIAALRKKKEELEQPVAPPVDVPVTPNGSVSSSPNRWVQWLDVTGDRVSAVGGAFLAMQIHHFVQAYSLGLGAVRLEAFNTLREDYLKSFKKKTGYGGCTTSITEETLLPSTLEACGKLISELTTCYAPLLNYAERNTRVDGELWMGRTERFERLTLANDALTNGWLPTKPFAVARYYDTELGDEVWSKFEWGVDASVDGAVYALAGVVLGVSVYYAVTRSLGSAKRVFSRLCGRQKGAKV